MSNSYISPEIITYLIDEVGALFNGSVKVEKPADPNTPDPDNPDIEDPDEII